MARTEAKCGLLTCWSCGSSKIKTLMDKDSENYPYYIKCEDCGEHTLNCKTVEQAREAWNKAYAVSMG